MLEKTTLFFDVRFSEISICFSLYVCVTVRQSLIHGGGVLLNKKTIFFLNYFSAAELLDELEPAERVGLLPAD